MTAECDVAWACPLAPIAVEHDIDHLRLRVTPASLSWEYPCPIHGVLLSFPSVVQIANEGIFLLNHPFFQFSIGRPFTCWLNKQSLLNSFTSTIPLWKLDTSLHVDFTDHIRPSELGYPHWAENWSQRMMGEANKTNPLISLNDLPADDIKTELSSVWLWTSPFVPIGPT